MLHPDVLIPISLIAGLLLLVLILWLVLRRRITETQEEQVRQSDQLDVLENKMARIEGALFYGPSATWTMEKPETNSGPGTDRPERFTGQEGLVMDGFIRESILPVPCGCSADFWNSSLGEFFTVPLAPPTCN